MSKPLSAPLSASPAVFRVDRFAVPPASLDRFMPRLRHIQRLLADCEGCRQNLVLQGPGRGDTVAVVTIVEWSGEDTMAAARASMQARHASEGFEPAAFMHELGIQPDLAVYRAV